MRIQLYSVHGAVVKNHPSEASPVGNMLFDLTWEIEAALAALKATRRGTRDFVWLGVDTLPLLVILFLLKNPRIRA